MFGVGDDELTVRPPDVGGQCLTAARGVQAAQDVAAKPGRRHLGQHVGRVTQQDADVHRSLRIGGGNQGRGLRRRLRQVLTPIPLQVTVFDGDSRIRHAVAQMRLNRVFSHQRGSTLTYETRRSVLW